MAKDTFFFSHDYNTRSDIKIKKLMAKHGWKGYGLFWGLIEELYNNKNELPLDYKTLSHSFRVEPKILESIIEGFELFVIEIKVFGSLSVEKRLAERNSKSIKASESAIKRWGNYANAKRTQSDSNAIKERKGKESIVKEIKEPQPTGFVLPFATKEFSELWEKLRLEKKWRNKSPAALESSLKKLAKFPEPTAIQMIENCIAGEWQGLVEIQDKIKTLPGGAPEKQPRHEQILNDHEQYIKNLRESTGNQQV